MRLFEHFSQGFLSLYLEARILIRICIRIKVKGRIRIRIRINLQMTSQNVWNMSLFEHVSHGFLSFYLEARIRIRICIRIKVKGRIRIQIRIKLTSRIRIRIKVMQIRNTVSKSFFFLGPRYKILRLGKPGSKNLIVFAISVLILNQRQHHYASYVFLSL
jgi:hypothetical protein